MSRNLYKKPQGFSLFELMIALAVLGIVSTVAVPAYRGYIDTANMTRVTAQFEESVRLAQATYRKDHARYPLGLNGLAPTDTAGWITLFNKSDMLAPGGGPAYIPSTNNKNNGRGDAVTGAIGVRFTAAKAAKTTKKGKFKAAKEQKLQLWRPKYSSLVGQRATITDTEIVVKIQP